MTRTFETQESWSECVEELDKKLDGGATLTGEDAAIILAAIFEGGTHGNYEGGILWSRAEVEKTYDITIVKKKS